MRRCCRGCGYRIRKDYSGADICTYILWNYEPRGCEPEECKAKGKYITDEEFNRRHKAKGLGEW